MNKFALFISFLFHPVLFFVIMPFFVVYKQTHDILYALKWELFSLLYVLIALVFFFIGRRKKFFSDLDLTIRRERNLFYTLVLVLALLYLSASVFFKGPFFPLSIISIGIVFGILLFEVVNNYIKASVHLGIVGAWVLSMGIFYGLPTFLGLFLLIPLVSWSRLILKRHTKEELVVGLLLGFFITILTYFIGVNIR